MDEVIDLLVIGGGINGCGVARDAAGRGLKVTLCEKDDLAAHTSSASTKLIHGGLRYLEYYDFLLVHHSLKERETLLKSAPHIIWPLRFILPHHKGLRPRWLIRLGLFIYDHIGGRKKLPASSGIDLREHKAGQFLKAEFTHAFEYSDCWVQDARLVILNARDAADRGANIMTHYKCIGLLRHKQHWTATMECGRTGNIQTINAKVIVNASGPWTDELLKLAGEGSARHSMRLVKGSHIVVKKVFDHQQPYIFQNTDGRILFAIPFENNFTLLGTTDQDFTGDPAQVEIDQHEINYICQAISQYTKEPVSADQVVWSYSGVRPLFDDASSNISKVSRDYELKLDVNGPAIVSIYGGKITTYRKLAEEVMGLLKAPLQQFKQSWTENSYLPGGNIPEADFGKFIESCKLKYPWLDDSIVRDYCRNYGTMIDIILGSSKSHEDLGEYFGGGLYECEVVYLMENEWASCSDDIVWRRSKKGLLMRKHEQQQLQQWMLDYSTR